MSLFHNTRNPRTKNIIKLGSVAVVIGEALTKILFWKKVISDLSNTDDFFFTSQSSWKKPFTYYNVSNILLMV